MTCRLLLAVITVGLTVGTASAQSDRPARSRPESSIDATVDLFGSIDRAFDSSTDAVADPASGNRSAWGGNSSLAYRKATERFEFGASAGVSVRRVELVSNSLLPSYSGTVTASGPLSRRSRWNLEQSLGYGATNADSFFGVGSIVDGGSVSLPLVDLRLADQEQFVSNTRMSVSYNVSRRGTLTGSVGYSRSSAIGSVVENPDAEIEETLGPITADTATITTPNGTFQRWDLAGNYSYQVTRYLSWRAGYFVSENGASEQASDVPSARLHTVDLGFGYSRPLSFSRRTRISTQLGSTIIQPRFTGRQQWRATGNAGLTHQIGRTWIAQVGYVRDTRFVPTFVDPILNDGVSTSVGGNLSGRQTLDLGANYSTGTIGIETGSNGYRMASASASYRLALFTRLAVFLEYFLFDFDFDSGVQLDDSLFNESRRHGLRIGLTIGTGLMGNRRRDAGAEIGEGRP
jgi:hypothetical protein